MVAHMIVVDLSCSLMISTLCGDTDPADLTSLAGFAGVYTLEGYANAGLP